VRARATRWLLFITAIAAFSVSIATGVALAAEPGSVSTPSTIPATGGATTAGPMAPSLTRYDQTDPAISYSGTWTTVKKTAASGRSYARANTAGASVTIAFNGTRLDWIATLRSTSGAADIYLDGAFVRTVDLRDSRATYQHVVWSTGTLTSGVHTVRIVRNAGSVAGADVTIDAVDVAGTLVKCQWVEQNSSLLAYKDSSVTVSFTGTYLAWVGQKGPTRGSATVTVDETQTFAVDLTAASTAYRLWDSGQLTSGAHTVTIEWTAGSGPLATGTSVVADGFLVLGTVTQAYVWHRIQDSDPRVLYWGTWTPNAALQASGGSDKRAGTSQAMVTVTFTGKQLDWIATTGPGLGEADVSIDSGPARLVHLSGAVTRYQQKVWSTGMMPAGTHTVQISWDKNSPAGAGIDVDAFDVLGVLPSTTDLNTLRTMWAEQKLSDLSYRPGTIDGVVDSRTRSAVMAFEKWEGLQRNGKLTDEVFSRLQTATRPAPTKPGGGDRWIEIDKTKQVLLYCENGTVLWTLPVSTGSPSVGIATPSGTFKVTRKTLETNPRWHPLYLRAHGYLAIHGYPSVPARRASHGCVRTQIWDHRDLFPLVPVGTSVYVY
jgi:hypothetical protein